MTAQMIPCTANALGEILSPQDLAAIPYTQLGISLLPLWAKPGEAILQTLNLTDWAAIPQTLFPMNGLQWFYDKNMTPQVSKKGLTYRSPVEGNALAISAQTFIALQMRWQCAYLVSLSAPFYAFQKEDAVKIFSSWITESLAAMPTDCAQKLWIELPCLPAGEMVSLIQQFAPDDRVGGLIIFLENNPEMYSITSQIFAACAAAIPAHWQTIVNTDSEMSHLQKLRQYNVAAIISYTPYADAQQGYFYTQGKKENLTELSFATDLQPLDKECRCQTCQQFTRAYLHHLLDMREIFAWRLLAMHNWALLR